MGKDITSIEGKVIAVTDKAILFEPTESGDQEWIPLSQIEETLDERDKGETLDITVPEWLARQKGWN